MTGASGAAVVCALKTRDEVTADSTTNALSDLLIEPIPAKTIRAVSGYLADLLLLAMSFPSPTEAGENRS